LAILLALLAAYLVFLLWVVRSGRMERWNLSLMLGVILMVRTQRGKRTLDAIARPRRLWNLVGDLGIALTLTCMVAMTAYFLYTVWLSLQPHSGIPALGLKEIFVIPGVNPFVPLWYGIVALVVTLVVHEGGHGVLARANRIKVKSLGLLFLVLPIGAFVEPEELDLKVAPRRQRLRVFGAGPFVNFVFAVVALLAMASVASSLTPTPGAWIGQVSVATDDHGQSHDMPAKAAGIRVGDIVTAAWHGDAAPPAPPPIRSAVDYTQFLNASHPGDRVGFRLARGVDVQLTLTSLWDILPESAHYNITAGTPQAMAYCKAVLQPAPTSGPQCSARMQDAARSGVSLESPADFDFLRDPVGHDAHGIPNIAFLVELPLAEVFQQSPITSVYLPAFYTSPAGSVAFVALTMAFWIFWINLMVGLTNVLPMLPLDGGHIFREAFGGVVAWMRPALAAERRERIVGMAATVLSLVILCAMLVSILAPHFLA